MSHRQSLWIWRTLGVILVFCCLAFFVSFQSYRKGKAEVQTVTSCNSIAVATQFAWPVSPDEYSRGGGLDFLVETSFTDNRHQGYDLNANNGRNDLGDPVYSVASGSVVYAGWANGGFGNMVVIEHRLADCTPIWSAYAHLNSITVALGNIGFHEQIGTIGQTGCGTCGSHLHWEMRIQNRGYTWGPGEGEDDLNFYNSIYINPPEFVNRFNAFMNIKGMAVLFEDSFFRGRTQGGLNGFYSLENDPLNNQASAVAVPNGWGINLFDRSDGKISQDGTQGVLKLFQTDWDLGNNEFSSGENANNLTSSYYIYPLSCANAANAAALNDACNPNPAPEPGTNPTPAPPPSPNPGDVVGISFFRDKSYSGLIRKLGYGEQDFSDDFLSVRMDNSNMHFTTYEQGGGKDCFDTNRFGGNTQYHSMNDHGDWWHRTTRIKVEYGSCPQGNPPTKWVVFYREKNFANRFTEKPIGFNGGLTDNFQSVKLDEGVSFITVNDKGESTCFDKWRFDGRNESSSFNDHGDWWHNTVAVMVQNNLCPPSTAELLSPRGEIAYNTDVTLVVRPPNNAVSVYGELWGLSTGPWYFNQPVANTNWHVGYLPSGDYTVVLQAVNDNGRSQRVEIKFNVQSVQDCNSYAVEGVILFDGIHCSGDKIELTSPGWFSLNQFDNRTSSVWIKPGWSVEAVEKNSTSDGMATCLTDTQWNLSHTTYRPDYTLVDESVSTVRVFNTPNCDKQLPIIECDKLNFDGVALFDYKHCLGEDRVFTQPRFYNLTDFFGLATSIAVKEGWSVRAYQDHTRGGKYICFNESKWNLSFDPFWHTADIRADNTIKSIEVFHDSSCGWPKQPQLYEPNYRLTSDIDFVLNWENIYAGSYWAELHGPNGFMKISDQLASPEWHVEPLQAGEYVLKVRAEVFGQFNEWSELRFTVHPAEGQPEPPPYQDCNTTGNAVRLFSEDACKGESLELGVGTHELDPAQNNGTINFNDKTNSIWLPEGWSVRVRQDAQQTGLASCYGETMWNLRLDKYWGTEVYVGGTISSLQIFSTPDCGTPVTYPPRDCNEFQVAGAALFDEHSCIGDALAEFTAPGYYLIQPQATASSLWLQPGWSAEVYSNSTAQDGAAVCISETSWNLASIQYYQSSSTADNSIKAVQIHHAPNCGKQFPQYTGCDQIEFAGIVLFDYKDCSGREVAFNQPGIYKLADWNAARATTSIHVAEGWSLRVFETEDLLGTASFYAHDMWNLATDKYWNTDTIVNNTIAMVQVCQSTNCEVAGQKVSQVAQNLLPRASAHSTNTKLTLNWYPESEAASYYVQVQLGEKLVMSTTVSNTNLVIPLQESGQYTWRVAVVPSQTSPWRTPIWAESYFYALPVPLPELRLIHQVFLPVVVK